MERWIWNAVKTEQILSVINDIQGLGYTMAPADMSMDMHMFSAMYAVNGKFSIMAMLPYIEKEMKMKMLTGMMAAGFTLQAAEELET